MSPRTPARDLDFLAQVERDGYAPRKKYPAESWAGSYQAARKYASKQPYRVILRMPGGHSAARDVTPLTREFAAESFAKTGGRGWSVIVEIKQPVGEHFKDASGLVRAFSREIGKVSQPPVQTESEWLLAGGLRIVVRRIRRDQALRRVFVELGGEQ